MKRFSPAGYPFSRRLAAFTLLELLVVISIIAVLAGILLPVTSSVMDNARKTSAKSTETQIITSIKNYQTDYGVYPSLPSVPAANPSTDMTVGGGTTNSELFNLLRAIDTAGTSANTRRIVYFEGKDVKTPSKSKDGFVPSGVTAKGNLNVTLTTGDLVDAWGNRFFVRYDSGYSDQVNNPYGTGAPDDGGANYSSTTMLRNGVIVWSYGKDGLQGKAGTYTITSLGDDVVSWQ